MEREWSGTTGRRVEQLADKWRNQSDISTTFFHCWPRIFWQFNHPDSRFSWIDPDYENLEDQVYRQQMEWNSNLI